MPLILKYRGGEKNIATASLRTAPVVPE